MVRAGALAAAVAVVAGIGAAPAASAASHHGGRHAQRAAAKGFTPARTAAAPVVALAAPAAGEVWAAERDDAGKLVLEHLSHGRWTTSRPGLDAGYTTQVSGSAANDVWLVAGGALRHWDGSRWSAVATPKGLAATAVTDVAGGEAYVGIGGDDRAAQGVYRVSTSRKGAKWTALGRPADVEGDYGPTWSVTQIAVTRGQVFTAFTKRAHSATNTVEGFSYRGGRWTDLGMGTFSGGGEREGAAAWIAPNPALFLAMGSFDYGSRQGGSCHVWVQGSGASTCTTGQAIGGAALQGDGRIVLGGNDFAPKVNGPITPGTFALRDEYGRETPVAGDPGDRTVALAVEPGSNTAWAATQTGDVTTLQSWRH